MTQTQATLFLTSLRAKNIKVKGNGWIECSCLFAKWLHKSGKDNNPSFGIYISPGERSHFLCFSCARSGSVEELLQSIEFYSQHSNEYDFKVCHALLDEELSVLPLGEYQEFQKPQQVFIPFPEYWLNNFPMVSSVVEPMVYLGSRGVSMETIQKFDLRFDFKREMVVCPYRNVFCRLSGARGRSIIEGTEGFHKHYDYTFKGINNCALVWYNEGVLNLSGPVVVVEGQFDCWRVERVFKKVVANLTAKPNFEKMKKLTDCPLLIQIPDRDVAGIASVDVYKRMCYQLGIRYKTLWLDEGVKDPDECHPEYLKDKIEELCN